MHKRFSLISVWVATCLMLLSTIVMHHHHYERVCIVIEHCDADVSTESCNETEEGHSHQEADRGSCRVHQLHRFIINASTARDLHRHVTDGMTLAGIPSCCAFTLSQPIDDVTWHHSTMPIGNRALCSILRRGPPHRSL